MDFKRELLEWVKTIVLAVAIALLINFFGGIALVEGQSMNPTLDDNDLLLRASYRFNKPKYGDIVVFKTDIPHPWGIYSYFGAKKALVKRVIGLPGDRIVVTNGQVYRNDVLLDEPYLKDNITDGEVDSVVPEGNIFVMGDNRLNSNDSRWEQVGFVSNNRIIGKIVLRFFPFDKFGTVK